MKAIWAVLLVFAVTMGLLAGIVFGLGDKTIFVPPPEAVVEGFMRELATGRYERARAYLSREVAARTGSEKLRDLREKLRGRTGDILDVRGEPGWHTELRAEAYVRLKTKQAGEPSLRFTLSLEEGVWAINGLGSLESVELEAR